MSDLAHRRICLLGVPGIGKSTLIRSVIDRVPAVHHLAGSRLLRELAGAEADRFDALPAARRQFYREELIRYLAEYQARVGCAILCDGHATLYNPVSGRLEETLTEDDRRFYSEFILLEAPAAVVLARRRQDGTRRRNLDPVILEQELELERRVTEQIAQDYRILLHRLRDDGNTPLDGALLDLLAR